MKVSEIRKKVDPLLVVRKRLPSYLKKEKISLPKSDHGKCIGGDAFTKKTVKYNQIPQFVQAISKFAKRNKLLCEEDNTVISKNKIIYINNLLSEIPKNKNILTSSLIHEIYRCLYKLNYLKVDVIITLFSILINNTIDFSNLSGYVNCNFRELMDITQYLYHFQNMCSSNIQSILQSNSEHFKLKVVNRYLTENSQNENVCSNTSNSVIYHYIYNYILRYSKDENIDILIYALLKGKNCEKKIKQYGKEEIKRAHFLNYMIKSKIFPVDIRTDEKNHSVLLKNCDNNVDISLHQRENNKNDINYDELEKEKELLIDYINAFYKLSDIFNFLLSKLLNYFNENTHLFDFYNSKILFFYIGKYKKYDLNLLEKMGNKIVEHIEKLKVNCNLLTDDDVVEEKRKYNYANNRIKKKRKKYVNTYLKIDSKEFLIVPYTIGLTMNIHFNNYLTEYVNVYILSLINSRVNCDMINFFYCLIGYKYIMLRFFILYNIFLFREKCLHNRKLLFKYNIFLNKLLKNQLNTHASTNSCKWDTTMTSNISVNMAETVSSYNGIIPVNVRSKNKDLLDKSSVDGNCNLKEEDTYLTRSKDWYIGAEKVNIQSEVDHLTNCDKIFDLLLHEFQINVDNIFLINLDRNALNQRYSSKQLHRFYNQYKNVYNKVYNYAIFLLSKYEISDMLHIYKKVNSLSLKDEVINHVYVEVLYEKIILNSEGKKDAASLLKCFCKG
ncbi:conserved Plasmodium protein, unknown function [Plasmodium ovale]|uniref:Uncharacterized protein n=2 Tax=Plasmodium ovale TaxID=36330 RepID=A0A1A8VQL7_PLAOA|nr:hypothetical protein, conserved [Plasmodium ovale curtisi]SBS87832.1 hypothetical protein, conserved [Plasmodium ovale curtisi]SCP04118.1 conserved Plasmodium protein, unknown function [Plasmodium ovale]